MTGNTMTIQLVGLTARGFHGVLESERRDGQPFVVDVTLSLPPPQADNLRSTVDYSAVAAAVTAMIRAEPVDLIETLAARVADELLMRWPLLTGVVVTVHKPQAPIGVPFTDVSCRLERCRQSPALPFVASLGANLGDSAATLRQAVASMASLPGVAVTAVSGIYRTTPVEVAEPQPDYLNLVVKGLTTLRPREFLHCTAEIEDAFGRRRPHHHAARTLDIDIVAIGDLCEDEPEITLPHPRAAERAFVLVPWLSIDPDARLSDASVADLAARLTQNVTLVSQFDEKSS